MRGFIATADRMADPVTIVSADRRRVLDGIIEEIGADRMTVEPEFACQHPSRFLEGLVDRTVFRVTVWLREKDGSPTVYEGRRAGYQVIVMVRPTEIV